MQLVRLCEFINSVNKMDKDRIWCVLQFENTWYVMNTQQITSYSEQHWHTNLTYEEAVAFSKILNAGEENGGEDMGSV